MNKSKLIKSISFGTVCLMGAGALLVIGQNYPKAKSASAAGSVNALYVANNNMLTTSTFNAGGGSVKYTNDGSKVKLTFNNFNYTGQVYGPSGEYEAYNIFYDGTLPVVMEINGTNSIVATSCTTDVSRSVGIKYKTLTTLDSGVNLSMIGTGSLNIKCMDVYMSSYGISMYYVKKAEVNGPTVTFHGGDIHGGAPAHMDACGIDLGSSSDNEFTITKGKVIAIGGTNTAPAASYGTSGETYGINAYSSGKMNINGGSLEASAGASSTGLSWGIRGSYYDSSATLHITSQANKVSFEGKNKAADGCFRRDFTGTGYITSTTTQTISTGGSKINENIKKVVFQNEIDEYVTGYNGGKDGAAHTIELSVDRPAEYEVKYGTTEGTYNLTTPPSYSDYGSHRIYYQITARDCETVTGYADININKLDPEYTAPAAASGLKYTGSAQALVTAGQTEDGTFEYKLGTDGTYSANIPEATEPGTYSVYYKLVGDADHKTVENGPINVTVAKGDATYVTEPTAVTGLVYDGQEHALVNEGFAANHGTVVFRIGNSGSYSPNIPVATNGGTYTVNYKILSDDATHYADSANKSFNVTIGKAANGITAAPTAVENLHYTGEAQTLANAGTCTGGTMQYKVDNGSWSNQLPKATNAGTYTVYYRVSGGSNYQDVTGGQFTVVIAENSKTELNADLDVTNSYYDLIKDDYPEIAGTLKEKIDAATSVSTNANKTIEQITTADNELREALSNAKIAVCEQLIDEIGEVENTEESRRKIELARQSYNSLSEDEKSAIPEYFNKLTEKEQTYDQIVRDHNTAVTCGIVFGIIGGLILLVGGAYAVLFLLVNKWINKDGKAIRTLPFALGKKDGKLRLMIMPCKFEYRDASEVYKTKDEALQ